MIAAARLKRAHSHDLQAASYRAMAESFRLEKDFERAATYEAFAVTYDGIADQYREMAKERRAEDRMPISSWLTSQKSEELLILACLIVTNLILWWPK